jgi:hypothetical protein
MSWLQRLIDAVLHPAWKSSEAEAALEQKAAAHPELHWRTSVVDLMKIVGQDSSLDARIHLAKELGYKGALDGSAAMNEFLHQRVLERLGIRT